MMPPKNYPKQPIQLPEGPADIRLEQDRVIVDAPFLILKGNRKEIGSDLDIDNSGRRSEHENPRRRALVHDFDDRLTLNWGKDYPGGVRIMGTVDIPGDLHASSLKTGSLLLRHLSTTNMAQQTSIAVKGLRELRPVAGRRSLGATVTSGTPSMTGATAGGSPVVITLDVADEILGMREKIATLEQRVKQLESVVAELGKKDK